MWLDFFFLFLKKNWRLKQCLFKEWRKNGQSAGSVIYRYNMHRRLYLCTFSPPRLPFSAPPAAPWLVYLPPAWVLITMPWTRLGLGAKVAVYIPPLWAFVTDLCHFFLPLTERGGMRWRKSRLGASRRAVAAQHPPACRSQAEVNETVCQGGFGREKVSDNEQMSLLFFAWEERVQFNLHCTQNPRDEAGRRQIWKPPDGIKSRLTLICLSQQLILGSKSNDLRCSLYAFLKYALHIMMIMMIIIILLIIIIIMSDETMAKDISGREAERMEKIYVPKMKASTVGCIFDVWLEIQCVIEDVAILFTRGNGNTVELSIAREKLLAWVRVDFVLTRTSSDFSLFKEIWGESAFNCWEALGEEEGGREQSGLLGM